MVETGQAIEVTGVDVEAAVAVGLARLGVDRDAVEIDVLDEGSRGLFGLGGREVRVRLTVRPGPVTELPDRHAMPPPAEPAAPAVTERDEAEIAQGVLIELLALLGMEGVEVDVRRAEAVAGEGEPPLVLNVHGSGTDALIGRRGNTLAALQLITRLIAGREMAGRVNLIVDVNDFKARREKSLHRLAQRLAEQAVRTGRTVVLEPMPPHERRYVHLALRDHPRVITQSIGEGERRKVTIIPRYESDLGR